MVQVSISIQKNLHLRIFQARRDCQPVSVSPAATWVFPRLHGVRWVTSPRFYGPWVVAFFNKYSFCISAVLEHEDIVPELQIDKNPESA